jgi:hypothetical protein
MSFVEGQTNKLRRKLPALLNTLLFSLLIYARDGVNSTLFLKSLVVFDILALYLLKSLFGTTPF